MATWEEKVRAYSALILEDRERKGLRFVTRTWNVDIGQARQVAELADSLNVPHSMLVRYLLRHALAMVDTGELALTTHPVKWELIEGN